MDKTQQRRKTSLFEDQVHEVEDFWPHQAFDLPDPATYKSQVFMKSKKKFRTDFSAKWLTFSYPMLYLSEKKNKPGQAINLELTPCKLYDYTLDKSKYPHKIVLRHHSVSVEFYFQEKAQQDLWISQLRNVCLMCDFTSMYTMGNLINKTGLSKTYWTQCRQTGKSYMAKIYNLQDDSSIEDDLQAKIEKQVIMNEIRGLRSLDHPNVIKLKEVHEFQGRIVLILEFISGSSLLKHILSQGALPEAEVSHIMQTLLKTLKVLHQKKILHRNLKPENILFDYTSGGTELKLSDFGFSCVLEQREQGNWYVGNNICIKCGTPGYMAPELLTNKQSTFAGDIFSMGVILYTCLMGEPMFKGQSAEDIISKNLQVSFSKSSKKWSSLSENARDLILKMVVADPHERPSIDGILKHPFFSTNRITLNVFGTTGLKSTWHSTGDSDLQARTRRSSLEDQLAKQSKNVNVDKALESLIVSPTYYDFSDSDAPEIPEFYIENVGDFESEGYERQDSRKTKSSKGLKLELIKGSLVQIDDERTPTFKVKFPDPNAFCEENVVDADEDYVPDNEDTLMSKNYKKFFTFPSLQHSPFTSQKPFVREFKTMTFKLETDFGSDEQLMTGRKLPELHAPAREKLGAKLKILDDLHKNLPKQ